MKVQAKTSDTFTCALVTSPTMAESFRAAGRFLVQCYDKNGLLKWQDLTHNLVVNQGLQDMNTQYFKGSVYTAAFYLGLITGPGAGVTLAAADTLASKAWTEFTNYSGARPAVTFGTATTADPSVLNNSGAPSQFSITGAGGVVGGAFLCTVSSGTSGILFSENTFNSPGDRTVVSGDTLNVTYEFSLNAV
jgi:hypothetical protein